MPANRWAKRLADIQPFHVMALLGRAQAMAAAGRDIIHLEVGEPDFPTPPPIVAAGQSALARGETFYTPLAGPAALVATPSNPTGGVLSRAALSELAAAVRPRGHLLVDEIYQGLNFFGAEFARRIAFMVPALESLGFVIPVKPEGAFYIYADVSACAASGASCRPRGERAMPARKGRGGGQCVRRNARGWSRRGFRHPPR